MTLPLNAIAKDHMITNKPMEEVLLNCYSKLNMKKQ